MYRVYWVNHGFYSHLQFDDLDAIKRHVQLMCFEARVERCGQPVLSWSPTRGWGKL